VIEEVIKERIPARTAIVSIHDATPDTLSRVFEIMDFLKARSVRTVTLLVVTGKDWSAGQIDQLHKLQQDGINLAAHGWKHCACRTSTLWHKLHARIVSRQAAEHLSLSKAEIIAIISRSYQWFIAAGLMPPELYVPPAWAMGNLPLNCSQRLPFRLYETPAGVYDCVTGKFYRMPVIGYLADTRFRKVSLKLINSIMLAMPYMPTRIAIHPDDLHLPLMSDLSRHLAKFCRFLKYTDITGEAPRSDRSAV
jgi:predicted deacetylase